MRVYRGIGKLAFLFSFISWTGSAIAQNAMMVTEVDDVYLQAYELYVDLHRNPELSGHETQTALKLAERNCRVTAVLTS